MRTVLVLTAGLILTGAVMAEEGCPEVTPPRASTRSAAGPRTARDGGIETVVRRVLPALVRIEVLMEQGRNGRLQKRRGFGSGVIIDAEGHVLTNHHVAGRGTRFLCTLVNREEIPATLVGTDPLADLAVIRLDLSARRNPDADVAIARFGDSAALKVGDVVFALGSPAALSQSVTKGIVANAEMVAPKILSGGLILDGEKVGELVRWIGHDAVIFGGNSGGPLVNDQGEIVGVNEVGIGSLGGAIPGNLAKEVAKELIVHGEVTRGWIGMEVQSLLRGMKDEKGALVASVFRDSPADRAGLRPGDFIHEFNGVPIPDCRSPEDLPVFNAMVLDSAVGSKIALAGQRGGKPVEWKVEVARRSPTKGFETEFTQWGMTASEFTPMESLELKREDCRGVQVHTVRAGGPAAEAKPALAPDDVVTSIDGHDIVSLEDFRAYCDSHFDGLTERKPVLVAFERGLAREQLLTVVKVGPKRKAQNPLTADRGWLGAAVQVLDPELARALHLAGTGGVRITRISKDSPAQRAGLRPGDIVTRLNGRVLAIHRPEDVRVFNETISAHAPGNQVSLEVIRGEETLSLEFVLAARPQEEDDAAEWKDPHFEFTARDLTVAVRDKQKLPEDLVAVRVVEIVSNGWASFVGLKEDDLILAIDGRPIPNVGVLEKTLDAAAERQMERVVFFVQRGVRHLFIEIESPPEPRNEKVGE